AQTYSNPNQRCKDVEFVCMDAAAYPLPPVPTVLFFFNPFGAEVMTRVIQNVRRSCQEHPRELYIFYAAPVLEALWTQAGFVERHKWEAGYLAAYRAKIPEVARG